MMMTPALTSTWAANSYVDWEGAHKSIVTMSAEIWEDVSLFAAAQPCQEITDYFAYAQDQVKRACDWKRTISMMAPPAVQTGCEQYRDYYGTPHRKQIIKNLTDFCQNSVDLWNEGPQTRREAEKVVSDHI